ncbi:MAG: hypothetical protein AAGA09_08310 [Pseudomonadota bacterium]
MRKTAIKTIMQSQHPALRAGFVAMNAIAVGFLVFMAWPTLGDVIDFKYFWLSGTLWRDGVSPYGPELIELGRAHFPGERINPFFYPPSWRLPASALALMPLETAEDVWAFFSVGCVIAGAYLGAKIVKILYRAAPFYRVFVLYLFAVANLSDASAYAILIGQTSQVLFLMFTILIYTSLRPNTALTLFALTVLLLKPQFGIPLAFACFIIPSMRTAVLGAGAVTALLAAYGLATGDPIKAMQDLLHNLSLYSSFPENWPVHMSGPNFALHFLGGAALSPSILLCASLALIALFGALLMRARLLTDKTVQAYFVLFAGLTTLFLASTHNSNLVSASPVLLMMFAYKRYSLYLSALGIFLIMRAMTLSFSIDGLLFAEKTVTVALLDTVGTFLLAFVTGGFILERIRSEREAADTPSLKPVTVKP